MAALEKKKAANRLASAAQIASAPDSELGAGATNTEYASGNARSSAVTMDTSSMAVPGTDDSFSDMHGYLVVGSPAGPNIPELLPTSRPTSPPQTAFRSLASGLGESLSRVQEYSMPMATTSPSPGDQPNLQPAAAASPQTRLSGTPNRTPVQHALIHASTSRSVSHSPLTLAVPGFLTRQLIGRP